MAHLKILQRALGLHIVFPPKFVLTTDTSHTTINETTVLPFDKSISECNTSSEKSYRKISRQFYFTECLEQREVQMSPLRVERLRNWAGREPSLKQVWCVDALPNSFPDPYRVCALQWQMRRNFWVKKKQVWLSRPSAHSLVEHSRIFSQPLEWLECLLLPELQRLLKVAFQRQQQWLPLLPKQRNSSTGMPRMQRRRLTLMPQWMMLRLLMVGWNKELRIWCLS